MTTNNPLWLPDWDVDLGHLNGAPQVTASAIYLKELEACPHCGSIDEFYRHGRREVKYRDTPAYGKQVVIAAQRQRYNCHACNESSKQPLPDMDADRQMTKRLMEYIAQQGIRRTFREVARDIGLKEKAVRSVCTESFREQIAKWEASLPYHSSTVLGIDEVNILGRKRTTFADVGGKRLLDILPSMKIEYVEAWLKRCQTRDRVQIVAVDMYGPYKALANKWMPKAKVIVDKFHILKPANEALRDVHIRAQPKRKDGKKKRPRIHKTLLQTGAGRLDEDQEQDLGRLLRKYKLSRLGHAAKKEYYAIWDTDDRDEAERRFIAWRDRIPAEIMPEFGKVARMVMRHYQEVFAYFDHQYTNAYTEAKNRFIKDLRRAGRGYSFEILRAKAILARDLGDRTGVCEFCLGQFLQDDLQWAFNDPEQKCNGHCWTLCGRCLAFHQPQGFYESATPF